MTLRQTKDKTMKEVNRKEVDQSCVDVVADNFEEIIHEYFVSETYSQAEWLKICTESVCDQWPYVSIELAEYVRSRVRDELHAIISSREFDVLNDETQQ